MFILMHCHFLVPFFFLTDQSADWSNRDLPCPLFFLEHDQLKQFKTFDHLSQYMLQSEQSNHGGQHIDRDIVSALGSTPLNQIAHFTTLGSYLHHLYEQDKFMDVNIEVDGEKFRAHRIALCCFSNYFADILLTQDSKTVPVDVKLLGISAKAFACFLEFVYTGGISVNAEIAGDMLVISEFLDVRELKKRLKVIATNLPLAQAVKIIAHSRRGSSNQLYELIIEQIHRNFVKASRIPEFLDIDLETFCGLLASGK